MALLLVTAWPRAKGQNSPEAEEAAAFARAQQAERAGDFQTAERIYLEALRKHPGEMAAKLNLGLAYYMDHRYAESRECLLEALRVNPALFPALMVAGVDDLKLGKPERAVPLLRRARALRPDDEYVNHNLASAEYLAGDYLGACEDYVRYLRLQGRAGDVPAWYGLGETSLVLSRQASARLGAQPRFNPYRLRLLAMVYRDQQEWDLAISRLRQLETQPAWKLWAELQIGDIELHQGQFSKASATFRQAISAQPDSARAHFGLGVSLLFQGNTTDAVPELVAASQQNPWLFAHPESLVAEGAAQGDVKIQELGQKESGSALVDAFLKAVGQKATGKDTRLMAAFNQAFHVACEQRHKTNEARLDQALRSHASSREFTALANEFLTEGDVQSASDAATHLQPESKPALILRARVLAAQQDALGTAATLLRLYKSGKDQSSPETDWWVSTLFLKVAELTLNQVLTLDPGSVQAHLLQAQMDDARNRTDAAIHQFQLAVQVNPDDPTTHFRLGEELWRAGRFQEAIAALKDGLRLDSHNAAAYYQIGDSYFSLAEPAQALPFLTAALKQDPDLYAAYKDLGSIYLNQNQFRRAAELLDKVAARDQDGSVHYLLFRAYSRLGQKDRAAACLQQFRKLKSAAQDRDLLNADSARAGGMKSKPLSASSP
jgi:tetratricopeptide (TPR) repeat protein